MKYKNHFFLSYAGNKRNEFENIYDQIKDSLEGVEYIVEPFCGSSAFSFFLSLKHPKRFKYILNDNNEYLIEAYRLFTDDAALDELILKLNAFSVDIDKQKYNEITRAKGFANWFYKHKVYSIHAGLFPIRNKIETDFSELRNTAIIDFLKNEDVTVTCGDAMALIVSYNQNKNAFLFLDPPYLIANNDNYHTASVNVYEYMYDHPIDSMQAKMVLVLEDNWIIRLLFKANITSVYGKQYMGSKKRTSHLVIKNAAMNGSPF